MSKKRAPGWVPQQHGAWAMLVVPYLAGLILRARADDGLPWYVWPLFAFWMLGYFTFNAASQWLKAPAKRRPKLRTPVLTYGGLSAIFGLLTLAAAGPRILWWVPAYLVFLIPALVLAAQRHERATIGGGLTIAAAALMTLVVCFVDPFPLARLGADPAVRQAVVVAVLLFAYFFGTVFYVKTNIRERGNPVFYVASLAWHAAFIPLAAVLTGTWPWSAFFALTTARAAYVPKRRRPLTPKHVGFIEIGISTLALLIVWLT